MANGCAARDVRPYRRASGHTDDGISANGAAGRVRGLSGKEGRDGRKTLTGPPARRNLVHTQRNALPDQVDLAVLLVPAVIALYRSLGATDRPWVGFGCGVFATIIPTLFAVLMVHGRLAFPVYGITLDDQPLPWWCRSTTGVCTRSASFSPALRSCWVSP